jgi:Uncharacterized conserved protein (DUF2183)
VLLGLAYYLDLQARAAVEDLGVIGEIRLGVDDAKQFHHRLNSAYTGVANKLRMLWRLFVEDAQSRVAFPGAGALYQALHGGVSEDQQNPMFFVSRAPWGIYEVLEEFFDQHGIPVGPILFLREWGAPGKALCRARPRTTSAS